MARIRSIKPDFWTSEQVMECSPITRLMFIGMWNFADDHGRMPAAPKTIKAQIFPADDIDATNVRRMLNELSSNGLIVLYDVDGKGFLQITGWHHQKIDKRQPAKYPEPPKDQSPTIRRTVSTEGIGEDRKGSDRIEPESLPSVAVPAREADKPMGPIPADFQLTAGQIALCRMDADYSIIAERFDRFMAHFSESGGWCDDWSAAWENWWATNKPVKAKPRLVMNNNTEPKKPRAKPKRSLPPDWKPSPHAYVVAEEEGQSVEVVEKIFRSYVASSGKQYADHDEAFYNFIRNQKNYSRGSGNGIRQTEAPNRGSIVAAADRAIANLEREIAADNEMRANAVLGLPQE